MHAHNIVVILLCPHPTKGERGSGGGGGGGGGGGIIMISVRILSVGVGITDLYPEYFLNQCVEFQHLHGYIVRTSKTGD